MEDDDISIVHMIFQKLNKENFNLEDIIKIAINLMNDYPISKILNKNRKIKFENDSPIINANYQIDGELSRLAKLTDEKYILFKTPKKSGFIKYIKRKDAMIIIFLFILIMALYRNYSINTEYIG